MDVSKQFKKNDASSTYYSSYPPVLAASVGSGHVVFSGDITPLHPNYYPSRLRAEEQLLLSNIVDWLVAAPDIAGCIDLKGSPVVGKKVILKQKMEPKQTTTTDANGCYEFPSAVSGEKFEVIIKGPVVP